MTRTPREAALLNRKVHRWGAMLIALSLLVVIITGLMLQVKKQSAWVQPETRKGSGKTPKLSLDQLLETLKAVPEAEVTTWTAWTCGRRTASTR